MRVVFFGTAGFAVPPLEALHAQHAVVLCVTQPDRPQGRGLVIETSPVKRAAEKLKIPMIQPQRLALADVANISADIGVVAAYGQLICRGVIEHFPHGILGIHPSLLPKHRGAAPVAWALLKGDTTTGITIFRINEALDAGPLLIRREVAVGLHESAEALTRRLACLGAEETLRAVEMINAGQAVFIPQEESLASVAPKLSKAQGEIDWGKPAYSIDCQIRALAPWPGAWTVWRGQVLKIGSASPVEGGLSEKDKPGCVVAGTDNRLVIATGQGLLELKEVQLPGKRKITAKEFMAGYRLQAGDRLGGPAAQ